MYISLNGFLSVSLNITYLGCILDYSWQIPVWGYRRKMENSTSIVNTTRKMQLEIASVQPQLQVWLPMYIYSSGGKSTKMFYLRVSTLRYRTRLHSVEVRRTCASCMHSWPYMAYLCACRVCWLCGYVMSHDTWLVGGYISVTSYLDIHHWPDGQDMAWPRLS